MDKKPSPNKQPGESDSGNFFRVWAFWIFLFLIVMWVASFFNTEAGGLVKKFSYSDFYGRLLKNTETPTIKSARLTANVIQGDLVKEEDGRKRYYVYIPDDDKDMLTSLRANVPAFEVEPPRTMLMNLLYSLGPMLLFIGFLWYFSYKGNQLGSRIWSFGKSRAQVIEKEKATKVTFKDVAGVDEAKEELGEVIDFLKDPKKFQRLGGRIPRGVLLVGQPGCGKTLLAKAVAGEAEVPFFSISGSDFVEMFVGVGASRVRDLFEQAKKASKTSGKGCIVFIDEIDAVGRQRFAGIGGGHDEREQTLNQLLVEMDGFGSELAVIVMAATNRPDVLDPALLRPGRFDRHIVIFPPDIKGREEILKVHTRKLKLSPNIDLAVIARRTSGFSGADLANLCNEGALLAARKEKAGIEQEDLSASIERVVMGPEKKSRVMSEHERKLTAYHEAGHALLSLLLPEVDPMTKVSIIPRGLAGGYTLTPPSEDRYYLPRKKILGEIVMCLGGRAAEELTFDDITTGARSDLEEAMGLARGLVCHYGMSEKLPNLTLGHSRGPVFLGRDLVQEKDYSEETARIIDEEVKKTIDSSYQRAKELLTSNTDKLKALAEALLEKEVLEAEEARKITGLGAPPTAGFDQPAPAA